MCQRIRYRPVKGEKYLFRLFHERVATDTIKLVDFTEITKLVDAIDTINEIVGRELVCLYRTGTDEDEPIRGWKALCTRD